MRLAPLALAAALLAMTGCAAIEQGARRALLPAVGAGIGGAAGGPGGAVLGAAGGAFVGGVAEPTTDTGAQFSGPYDLTGQGQPTLLGMLWRTVASNPWTWLVGLLVFRRYRERLRGAAAHIVAAGKEIASAGGAIHSDDLPEPPPIIQRKAG